MRQLVVVVMTVITMITAVILVNDYAETPPPRPTHTVTHTPPPNMHTPHNCMIVMTMMIVRMMMVILIRI